MQSIRRNLIVAALVCSTAVLLVAAAANGVAAAELLIGAAAGSITPSEPVALSGQFHTRIARSVESPVTATALALETRSKGQVIDQAIMVSCDLVAIRGTIQEQLRERVKSRLAGFETNKLFLSATHTHTAPVMEEGRYLIPKDGVMQPSEYVEFLIKQLCNVVVKAWESRKPGGVSWALGHAVVGHNRRVVYEDATARMYGATDTPSFRNIEGYEDHGVEILFFWDKDKNLTAVAINLACPAQEVENRSAVNADFWHDVREQLRKRYSKDLHVLGWTGASGDQSPHLLYRKRAEDRMRSKRGLSRTQEIARRIAHAVDDTFDVAKSDIRTDVPLVHQVQKIQLPVRRVTEQELARATAKYEKLSKIAKRSSAEQVHLLRYKDVVDRYRRQDANPYYEMQLHVIRLGDVAIATNPFELFLDFGLQIKARSKAEQTFVVELAGTYAGYLPTARAVQAGGYGAEIESNIVGPQGGQVLVDRTVELIGATWDGDQR